MLNGNCVERVKMNRLSGAMNNCDNFSVDEGESKVFYLGTIASILSSIDHNKNEGGTDIVFLSILGMKWLDEMISRDLEVGSLPSLFNNINFLFHDKEALCKLVEDAHEEVANLLGNDESIVYSPL